MKALQSQLAKDLLADEQARSALRRVLVSKRSLSKQDVNSVIKLQRGATTVTVSASLVPKARVD